MNRKVTIALIIFAILIVIFIGWVNPLLQENTRMNSSDGYLLNIHPSEIHEISMVHSMQTITLKREGNRWILTQPISDDASSEAVAEIFEAATKLRASDKISAKEIRTTSLHLKDFGLHSPKQWIDFIGERNLRVTFGKDAVNPQQTYVNLNEDKDVFIVSDELQDLTLENVDFFRAHELTPWDAADVEAFALFLPSGELALRRINEQWMIVKPLRARADSSQTEKLLNALLRAKIKSFIPDGSTNLSTYGISEGVNELRIQKRYSKDQELYRFGEVTTEQKTTLYAQSIPRHLVASIEGPINELLHAATPNNLRDRHLLELNLDTVDRIMIDQDGKSLLLTRDQDDWIAREGEKQSAVPKEVIATLVEKLNTTMISSFHDVDEDTLKLSGLQSPLLTLHISAWLSENAAEDDAGEKKLVRFDFARSPEERLFVRKDEGTEIYALDKDILSLFSTDPQFWEQEKKESDPSPVDPHPQD